MHVFCPHSTAARPPGSSDMSVCRQARVDVLTWQVSCIDSGLAKGSGMTHPSTGTPLPPLILQPGGSVLAIVNQNPHRDST
eukprot:2426482-Amphidinium_carterae.1